MHTPDNYPPDANSLMEHTPSRQFFELASIILDIRQPHEAESPNRCQFIEWTTEDNKHYKLRKYIDVHDLSKTGIRLHVFSRENSYEDFIRKHVYSIDIANGTVGNVKKSCLSETGNEFVSTESHEGTAAEALKVLENLDPRSSFRILQKGYDASFPHIVGAFVLSQPETGDGKAAFINRFDDDSIDGAINKLEGQLTRMEVEALAQTLETYSAGDSSLLKRRMDMVRRAINTRPSTEVGKRTFMDVDTRDVAGSVALDIIFSSSPE